MNLKESYDRIAEDWHKDHQSDDWWVGGTDAFVSFLQPGDLVLDVGCGGGTKTDYLIRKGLRVVGIDFSDVMIEIARKEVPQGEFSVLDMHNVDTMSQLFDGIFMQASLLHIPRAEAESVLQSIIKRLKPGGYCYVAVKDKKPGSPDEEIKQEDDYGYSYERFFSYFTLDEIRLYMKAVGCTVCFENESHLKSRWIQVIGKKQ